MNRNAQIADLQQKVLAADSEGRLKQRIDGITSIVDAKCAVRVLMAEVRLAGWGENLKQNTQAFYSLSRPEDLGNSR